MALPRYARACTPVLALSLLLFATPANAAPAPESVASYQGASEVGGHMLHRYDGGWAAEMGYPKEREFNGVTYKSRIVGASLGGRQALFQADGTDTGTTLTLGLGEPGSTSLRSWQQRFGVGEWPFDLTPDGRGVVTAQRVGESETVLRRYPAGRAGQGSVLARLPRASQYPESVSFQYSGSYYLPDNQNVNINIGYGQDRLYANGPSWARYGGTFGPIVTPDGATADRILLSASGIAVVRTPKSFWRISAGKMERLSPAMFGADRGNRVFGENFGRESHYSALSVNGDKIAYASPAEGESRFEPLNVLDLRTGKHNRYPLPPNAEPAPFEPLVMGSAAWSWRDDSVYVLRHARWLTPHQPHKLTVQSVKIADGSVETKWPHDGRSVPARGPRLLAADVHP
ncbi:hypothetical protein [Crossiella cryophila]|uniref:Uncharacterized protein n=1 Tax=Crossiella cryophila TaxID=43355 RepID=A0A7W7C4Q3_9PSEU|nr:hypothetical protein [Crossiella cryophila]MBB4674516.1 hypothetical protein [Crossiella cryophila]